MLELVGVVNFSGLGLVLFIYLLWKSYKSIQWHERRK